MIMRMLIAATAAVIAATASISAASAGTIGCDPGQPTGTLNARSCSVWNQSSGMHAYAMAGGAPVVRYAAPAERGAYNTPPLVSAFRGRTDVSGGSAG
jgi:hypothetical protein